MITVNKSNMKYHVISILEEKKKAEYEVPK